MRLSKYFLPLQESEPREATLRSHALMLRAGMIRQVCSGIYTWLPLGLRVIKKIEQVIRQELDQVGCVEILMPCLQPSSLWHSSGRYEIYGKEMLKMTDRNSQEMIFGPTAEEIATDTFSRDINSYQALPKIFYQIQWKFRDEIRPRFGVMRAREFLLKDAYSFDLDKSSSEASYWKIYLAYLRIFSRLGLSVLPLEADSGAIGGNFSHEFHVLADVGESNLYFDQRLADLLSDAEKISPETVKLIQGLYAVSDEKHSQDDPRIPNTLKSSKGIEVGHTFLFGTKYSRAMDVKVQNREGGLVYPEMGSYGIGISRVVAAIIETHNDSKGIFWPKEVVPFKIGITNLDVNDSDCCQLAEGIYEKVSKLCLDTLYDDCKSSPGQKFALQDLIGVPLQVRVGKKALASGACEVKTRSGSVEIIDHSSLIEYLAKSVN